MAERKPKATIVRGPDGTLYKLTKAKAPEPLSDADAQTVENKLAPGGETEQKLEGIVSDTMQAAGGCTQRVHIIIPDVDI